MSSSSASHGFPLQAYNSVAESNAGDRVARVQLIRQIPVMDNGKRPPRTYDDVEFRILHVVGRNNIPIIRSSDVELYTSNRLGDFLTRSGFSMQVYKGVLKPTGQAVALKRFKTHFDEDDKEAMNKYGLLMEDFSFELQILSKPSLRNHRNIVTLLGITFSDVDVSSETHFSFPISVVELAHTQYPDLSLYFNRKTNPDLPDKIQFKISASFIADIADGVAALHKHDLVHADLKPENILLFPDDSSPNGLVAKISDFGFSGMTTYTSRGVRAPLLENIPRGGTREWNAPESLTYSRHDDERNFDKHPANQPSRDIYSFGLVACFVALNGRYPRTFVENLDEAKFTDNMINVIQPLFSAYYEIYPDTSFVAKLRKIIEKTLKLRPEERMRNLDDIRGLLFNGHSRYEHPQAKIFVLDFNLFPSTVHELKSSGLYDAYWASPRSFRRRAYDCFKSSSNGFGFLAFDRGIFKELEEKAED